MCKQWVVTLKVAAEKLLRVTKFSRNGRIKVKKEVIKFYSDPYTNLLRHINIPADVLSKWSLLPRTNNSVIAIHVPTIGNKNL